MLEKNKITVIDGAMGTSIQNLNLKPSDFGGEEYDGCNEYLNITNPQYIKSIHESFINVGANVIETNSFGGTPMVLDEYGLSSQAEEINHLSASIAKSAASQHSNILVAGSMGPTTKLLGLPQIKTSDITFDYLMENYRTQARGLISGGSDLLLVETSQDKSKPLPDLTAYINFSRNASSEEYGGSFRRFMHVAAVGSLVKSAVASGASVPAVPLRCTHSLGSRCENPSSGVLLHEVMNLSTKRWSSGEIVRMTRHNARIVGCDAS